jgi:hypothetical protein
LDSNESMVLNALELARTAANEGRTVVLVEGISDRAAIDALAKRRGCDPLRSGHTLPIEHEDEHEHEDDLVAGIRFAFFRGNSFCSIENKRTAREQLLARERFPGITFFYCLIWPPATSRTC